MGVVSTTGLLADSGATDLTGDDALDEPLDEALDPAIDAALEDALRDLASSLAVSKLWRGGGFDSSTLGDGLVRVPSADGLGVLDATLTDLLTGLLPLPDSLPVGDTSPTVPGIFKQLY